VRPLLAQSFRRADAAPADRRCRSGKLTSKRGPPAPPGWQ
jgi:hypothetical protein